MPTLFSRTAARWPAQRVLCALPALVMMACMGGGLAASVITRFASLDSLDLDASRMLDQKHRAGLSRIATTTTFSDVAARWGREANWLVLGDLGDQVRRGCDNWLFLADELHVHRAAQANAAQRTAMLKRALQAMQARGILLLPVIIPDKSRIEAGHLCRVRRPAVLNERVTAFMADLKAGGVAALDLTPVLGSTPNAPFLRTDTHWSEDGAHASATAVAAALRASGVALAPGTVPAMETRPASARAGDLVRLAGIERLPVAWQPAMDITVQSIVGTSGAKEGDLFGDADLPQVAVVGTSYSRNANFVPFLASALGSGVASFAKDGGDFSGSASAYFASAAFRDTPPRVIVWEIPERVLQMPPGAAEKKWLASAFR